ncbi:MAG: hypothetical protein AAB368_02110 [bacterium]
MAGRRLTKADRGKGMRALAKRGKGGLKKWAQSQLRKAGSAKRKKRK